MPDARAIRSPSPTPTRIGGLRHHGDAAGTRRCADNRPRLRGDITAAAIRQY
jgi:hypothetical protein